MTLLCTASTLEIREIFHKFSDKKIGFLVLGDRIESLLNMAAAEERFWRQRIDFRHIQKKEIQTGVLDKQVDEIVICGGTGFQEEWERSNGVIPCISDFGLPTTVLPQSIDSSICLSEYYQAFYVRDHQSQDCVSRSSVVPDLSLGLNTFIADERVEEELGVFLRRDGKGMFDNFECSLGDPHEMVHDARELFTLASKFQHIVTDRLQFCIAALLLKRKCSLVVSNESHSRQFHQSWLKDKCALLTDLGDISYDHVGVKNRLYRFLCGSPVKNLTWNSRPNKENGFKMEPFKDGIKLISVDGARIRKADEVTRLIWMMCDGLTTIEEMVDMFSGHFGVDKLKIAIDVQETLKQLYKDHAIFNAGPDGSSGDFDRDRKRGSLKGKSTLTPCLDIVVNEPRENTQGKIWSAKLVGVGLNHAEVWFSSQSNVLDQRLNLADPFLLFGLALAMRQGVDIKIHNAHVSEGLIKNLWEYQAAWCCWRKGLKRVNVVAEECLLPPVNERSISTFSGGVDSWYTLLGSRIEPEEQFSQLIDSAMMVHGFDIPLQETVAFDLVKNKNEKILRLFDISLYSVATNAKQYMTNWEDSHGLLLAACLTLFRDQFGIGVIAGTLPYDLVLPVGSNVITDRLMGSDGFGIEHHGASRVRNHKISKISSINEIGDNLRVCWEDENYNGNCCECLKCILAAISFDLYDQSPLSLRGAMERERVLKKLAVKNISRLDWHDISCIVEQAERMEKNKWWLNPLRDTLLRTG